MISVDTSLMSFISLDSLDATYSDPSESGTAPDLPPT